MAVIQQQEAEKEKEVAVEIATVASQQAEEEKKERERIYEEWIADLNARYSYVILSDELKEKMNKQ